MSGHIGRRLYANIYKRAHPLLSRAEQSSTAAWSSFITGAAIPSNTAKGLFRRNWSRTFSYSSPTNAKQITRRFASGGFLVLGTSPTSNAVESGASCAITSSEKIICQHGSTGYVDKHRLEGLAKSVWSRSIYTSSEGDDDVQTSADIPSRVSNTTSSPPDETKTSNQPSVKPIESESRSASEPALSSLHSNGKNVSGKAHTGGSSTTTSHFTDRLPHRPTKEELLAAATGFWSRLKVRFKWFSIRSIRPFNVDDIGAFFSWILLGHVLWIILGTTTFFSLLILAINTVFAQETLARWVGNYLTKSSGLTVVFESAIVPKWKDGVITFKNVFVSRRPGQGAGNVSKGSPKTAAETAAAAALRDNQSDVEEEDTNYTQFDVSINTVNVTLSFAKWFNGKGLLRDVEVIGVRGIVDRTHVWWPEGDLDPKSYRHEHNPGDFEIDSFKMQDLLVTIYQPNNFRPFSVSIFSCDLPQLRRQWLFYDFMSANTMSGSFDNSIFTIHPRQTHSYTGALLGDGGEDHGEASPWKKHSRIRIDGLSIDHLNRGVEGPFSWIHEGNVDIVADIMFPADNDESLAKVMSDFYDRLEAAVTSNRYQTHPNGSAPHGAASQNEGNGKSHTLPVSPGRGEDDKRLVVTDLRIHLNNIRAVVPLFTRDLSYVNNALIRPIVAYMNSKRTFIPIQCRLVKRVSDFDGSWTIYDSGLMTDLSAETYEAFAQGVMDEQARKRRFKKVGLWSLQLAAQAILMGMAGNIV
ncbi:mitochondrial distribution and morphology protein [Histoplasma capsulatum var. duboisii H88]|uniref:Mitochondrial distribution and morphology protein n=1 Tax=Ajellomyces capsulatus (strain H88) TaxID=544711 RepID=F0UW12_AJEC8|nr:mitochondrial distribution and morphology protein [Histoplasma capsulatum var. duboisii H88]QSS57437.1 mitochondrial distribution and morphology protein [Histoplasma capsulatum var. duboisii H88]